MRLFLRPLLMIVLAVLLTGSLATPHICLDSGTGSAQQIEKQIKLSKIADHSHSKETKSKDHCCIAHHCCSVKLLASAHVITTAVFFDTVDLVAVNTGHFSSYDPKGLDRPPKFFA